MLNLNLSVIKSCAFNPGRKLKPSFTSLNLLVNIQFIIQPLVLFFYTLIAHLSLFYPFVRKFLEDNSGNAMLSFYSIFRFKYRPTHRHLLSHFMWPIPVYHQFFYRILFVKSYIPYLLHTLIPFNPSLFHLTFERFTHFHPILSNQFVLFSSCFQCLRKAFI